MRQLRSTKFTDDPRKIAKGASSSDWRALASKAEQLAQTHPKLHAQWNSAGFPEYKRGVDFAAQIRRSDLNQFMSKFTFSGSHWCVYGDWVEGDVELAKRAAELAGHGDLTGEAVRDWFLDRLKNHFLKQPARRRGAIGFSGTHENGLIEDFFKVAGIYLRELSTLAPSREAMKKSDSSARITDRKETKGPNDSGSISDEIEKQEKQTTSSGEKKAVASIRDQIKSVIDKAAKNHNKKDIAKCRKKAVELYLNKQKADKLEATHASLYRKAGYKDRTEFYAWLRGDRNNGSSVDKNLRRVLLTDLG